MRLLFLILLLASAGCRSPNVPETITLGHLVPEDSDTEVNALVLALEHRASPRRWSIIHAQAGRAPEQMQAQAVRLVSVNRVQALLGGYSALMADRIGQAANTESVPALTFSGSILTPTNTWQIALGIAPGAQGKALGTFAREKRQLRKVVCLKLSESSANVPTEAFTREFRRSGDTAVIEIFWPKEETASDLVKRLKPTGMDGLFLCGSLAGRSLVSLLSALESTAVPILLGDEEAVFAQLGASNIGREEIICAVSFSTLDTSVPTQSFVKLYSDKFGKEPDAPAALAWDAMGLLTEAANKVEPFSANRIREELLRKDVEWDISTGKLKFAADQTARRPILITGWKEGKRAFFHRYEAD